MGIQNVWGWAAVGFTFSLWTENSNVRVQRSKRNNKPVGRTATPWAEIPVKASKAEGGATESGSYSLWAHHYPTDSFSYVRMISPWHIVIRKLSMIKKNSNTLLLREILQSLKMTCVQQKSSAEGNSLHLYSIFSWWALNVLNSTAPIHTYTYIQRIYVQHFLYHTDIILSTTHTLPAQLAGVICASVSCPRTLRHAEWARRGSNQQCKHLPNSNLVMMQQSKIHYFST